MLDSDQNVNHVSVIDVEYSLCIIKTARIISAKLTLNNMNKLLSFSPTVLSGVFSCKSLFECLFVGMHFNFLKSGNLDWSLSDSIIRGTFKLIYNNLGRGVLNVLRKRFLHNQVS